MLWADVSTINEFKKNLATSVFAIVRDLSVAKEIQKSAEQVFEQNKLDENMPTFTIPLLWNGRDLMVSNILKESGLSNSLSDARRLMKNGGVRIDGEKVSSDFELVRDKKTFKLSAGKKKHVKIEWAN
jgi:tyrosyl-tRNA synthetase